MYLLNVKLEIPGRVEHVIQLPSSCKDFCSPAVERLYMYFFHSVGILIPEIFIGRFKREVPSYLNFFLVITVTLIDFHSTVMKNDKL